jgi:hypothetical protein
MQKLSGKYGCMLLCGWDPPVGEIAAWLIATAVGGGEPTLT